MFYIVHICNKFEKSSIEKPFPKNCFDHKSDFKKTRIKSPVLERWVPEIDKEGTDETRRRRESKYFLTGLKEHNVL